MALGNVGIYKRKASRFVAFEEIDLHAHQEHVVFFFDQDRDFVELKLLVLRFGFVKAQGVGHTAAAATLDADPEEVVLGDVFGSHDVLDLGLGFCGDGDRDEHAGKIDFLGFWFVACGKIIDSAGFLTRENC